MSRSPPPSRIGGFFGALAFFGGVPAVMAYSLLNWWGWW
jgi:hypothetical protein